MASDSDRILSRPLKLCWAGWETDTYRLQQAGWQISAEQNPYEGRMRLAMSHEYMRMQAITPYVDFEYERAARLDYRDDYLKHIVIPVDRAIARDITLHMSGRIDWAFQPIDAAPQFTTSTITRLEDLCHFAVPLVRSQQIIIPEENVQDLMERILKLQQPGKTGRLREEMRNPEGLLTIPRQTFHAQVISLAA